MFIAEYRDHHVPSQQLYGAEVEMEYSNDTNVPQTPDGWVLHDDGSLRGGVEFVFNEPTNLEESRAKLVALSDAITTGNPTMRTSFHVHVDVRGWQVTELANVLRCYMTYEELFFELSGGRRGNQFCIPVVGSNVERTFSNFIITTELSPVLRIGLNTLKYAALNLGRIVDFGSIEFRHHAGLHSAEEAIEWLDLIHKFCQEARGVTREQLREEVMRGSAGMTHRLFGNTYDDSFEEFLSNFKTTESV